MKKDDIDKLFSSLEDFSKTPPDDLWQGIEEKLDNSKTKRRFPFWWSVAATLVVGLGLLGIFNSHPDTNAVILPAESKKGVVNQSGSADAAEKVSIENKTETEKHNFKKSFLNSNTTVASGKQEQSTSTKATFLNSDQLKNSDQNKKTATVITNKTTTVLANKNENLTSAQEIKNTQKIFRNQPNSIAEQNKIIAEKSVVEDKIKEMPNSIEEKENPLAAIEKELKNKEKTVSEKDRWSLQLFAGINNSQNINNQKSLGNTIESQKGYNYGVKTNYKLNRRWAVSTGLKISELGQQVANVSYVNAAKSLINVSKSSFSASPKEKGSITNNANYLFIPKNQNYSQNAVSNSFYETADLSQKVQYAEMPMEVSYAVLNKGKARVNLNTGGFVGKVISNKVLLNNSKIGENSDVNDVVFGTVLSSTLQYELYKKTSIFVEPGMNYYSQPVQNQNFNQFQVVFNFGLNVSF